MSELNTQREFFANCNPMLVNNTHALAKIILIVTNAENKDYLMNGNDEASITISVTIKSLLSC